MKVETCDVCVIGSGPAGLITAIEYAKANPSNTIILLEYGSKSVANDRNKLDDSIVIKNEKNHFPPYECTNKGLGGTSTTWGGRCVMYDEIDFTDREIINSGCTWEVKLLSELSPHLQRTADYFECGNALFDVNNIKGEKKNAIAENFINGDVTDTKVERWSMPTRFGQRYLKEIKALKNLEILYEQEARSFSMPDTNTNGIKSLTARSTKDHSLSEIHANLFIIAAGAQETTRLLLRNTQLFNNLDCIPTALGKFYQSHISGKIASVKFYGNPKKTDYAFIRDKEGIYLRRRFQFTSEFLARNNLLNTAIWLDNPLYYNPDHKSGAMSLMYLAMTIPFLRKKLAPPAIAESITKNKINRVPAHLKNIIKQFPFSIITPASIFFKRYCLKRKLPGVFLYSPKNKYALHFHAEQTPNEKNTMSLENDNETLEIDYVISKSDVQSVIEVHKKLDDWLRQCNCGELEYWFAEEDLPNAILEMSKDGIHQSGTTRIASNHKQGVVDNNLLLFGTSNLYVCSSSVFPTSSQANPTFFLGAFAVRLAQHLTDLTNEKNRIN